MSVVGQISRAPWRMSHSVSRHFVLFLTWRYLIRRPLSLVAIAALSFAVFALVIVPSVMNGFQDEFHARVRGTLSDIRVWSEMPAAVKQDAEYEKDLAAIPGVKAVAPFLETPALEKHLNKIDYCFISGIEPEREAKVSDFATYLLSERDQFLAVNDYDLASGEEKKNLEILAESMSRTAPSKEIYKLLEGGDPEAPGVPTCVVGVYLLRQYEYDITAKRLTHNPLNLGTLKLTTASSSSEVKQDRECIVVGTFRAGFSASDRRNVYMGLKSAQQLVGAEGRVNGYSLKLDDFEKAELVRKPLIARSYRAAEDGILPRRFNVKTWEEQNENLLRAVRMEKAVIRIIVSMIVLAAAMSILLVLVMTTYTKVRELGVLRAVGGSRLGVFVLFLGQGLLIATIAMAIGCALGVYASAHLNEIADVIHSITGFHPFPKDIYYLERIPSKIVPREVAEDFAITLFFAAIWGAIPALMAALRQPLRAIRYE